MPVWSPWLCCGGDPVPYWVEPAWFISWRSVALLVYDEQVENLALNGREGVPEGLDQSAGLKESVASLVLEEAEDRRCGGLLRVPFLGIER